MTSNEEIIELQKHRDTVQKGLNANSDPFFQYGYVRQLEEIDKKIEALKNHTTNDK